MLLLCAGDKKTQSKDIKLAKEYLIGSSKKLPCNKYKGRAALHELILIILELYSTIQNLYPFYFPSQNALSIWFYERKTS